MADQEKDNAAKARIITHMNKDHHDSIVRYLENYEGVSSWKAYDGVMCSIDLTGMTLICSGIRHRLDFSPHLTSYAEARERLVQMDQDSLKALGRSDVTVNNFPIPTGLGALPFLVCISTFLCYSQRWWFAPGGIVEQFLGAGFAKFSYTIQPYLITIMVLLHGAEAIYFALNKLSKHSVNPHSPVFWLWTFTTFIEGQFAYQRFDKMIATKRAAKEKQKH
ncbi:Hypothetical protein R9X50_00690100 [Acrodontium crateriforme]|uniref:DUF2470 domain-containing protein n=1 Tax=Acrodontium crateriforme TaxID=150365 RepID=A0AAQ3M8Q8_9PEZI|nr:Hypothetical protein R9X50_00690100 [Acrodontium crateriforme]